MRWSEWWHATGADPAQYFKPPRWGWQKRHYINGYLEGLHDAARVANKHGKETGHDYIMRAVMKAIHEHHNVMETLHD